MAKSEFHDLKPWELMAQFENEMNNTQLCGPSIIYLKDFSSWVL